MTAPRLAALALLLCGCSPGPEVPDNEPPPPAAASAAPSPSLWYEHGEGLAGESPAPGVAPSWQALPPVAFDAQGSASSPTLPALPGCRARLLRLVDPPGTEARGFSAASPGGAVDGGAGYGLFLLPDGVVSLPLSLTDPRFGGPLLDASLRGVAAGASLGCAPEIPKNASLRVELRVTVAQGLVSGPLLAQPWWNAAISEARRHFAQAGINLLISRVAHPAEPCPDETLTSPVDTPDMLRLHRLASQVFADQPGLFVPVALVRRLRWSDPSGQPSVSLAAFSTRLPGGFSPGPASLVLLATESDEGTLMLPERGRWLGMLLAHELGHYLGLFHDPELHTPDAPASTLMNARIAQLAPDQVAFSTDQSRALRRHPLVTFPEASP